MRSTIRDLLPSMFHRRLLLLALVMVCVLCVLGTATTMLATGQTHADAREMAESKLRRQQVIQTKRGAILDRNGVVLAEDEPGWELAVHYDLLTGTWARKQAYTDASRDKLAWTEMSQDQRERKVEKLRIEYVQQTEAMFRTLGELSGLGEKEVQQRRSDRVEHVHNMQSFLWRRWQKQASAERGEPVRLKEVAKPIAAEFQYHVLISDVSDAVKRAIDTFVDVGGQALDDADAGARSALPWTMIELRLTTVRRYPQDRIAVVLDRSTLPSPIANDEPIEFEVAGVGMQLVGMMRSVWAEDVAELPLIDRKGKYRLTGYEDGDRRGRSGVEQAMERQLRGSRGLRTINLDTGKESHLIESRSGRDVMLSIDIRLQAHVQGIMSPEFGLMQTLPWHLKPDDPKELLGTPLNGSAVVIDIASGDVLAAVSMPNVPRDLLMQDPELFWNDPINQPMLNRAFEVPYQPGSTLKPFVLAAVVSEGLLAEHEKVYCRGYLWDNRPDVFRDWYYKSYGQERGEIDGVQAIEVSNNPFFGMMAKDRLIPKRGISRLPQWYEAFGMGQKPGTGLLEEIDGSLGKQGRAYQNNEVCFMAIGQGPVDWTPLQAATAYMRLAAGDLNRKPRVFIEPKASDPGHKPSSFQITPTAQRMVFEGMRRSAGTNDGTTHHINAPSHGLNRESIFNVQGVTVMAKSGTADVGGARHIDFNRNGIRDEGEIERNPRDHAWVVALVQPDGAASPTHAIVCVVEYAGSGGRVAGPVVNQIIHALQQHQYLEWPPTR